MTMTEPAVDREKLVARLASEVTLTPEPPSEDLRRALEQLINEVLTGSAGERPLDWAQFVAEGVAGRHGGQ